MEMQQLRHFVSAVEHGNLGKAARALNITQPALSRSIRNLENAVGAPLLERTARGVAPTMFGETLMAHSRAILNEAARALDDVRALKGVSQGHVAVGITENFASHVAPEAVSALVKERPGVSVSIAGGFYDELVARLRRGELDFLFALFPTTPKEPDLVFDELLISHSRVFAGADHPLAKKARVALAELVEHPWVVVDHQPAMTKFFRSFFEDKGLSIPTQTVRTDSVTFLKSVLAATGYLTVMPEHLMRDELANGKIVRIDCESLVVTSRCGVVTRRRGAKSPAAVALMKSLQAVCARVFAEVETAPPRTRKSK